MANLFCALPQELQTEILTNLDAVSLVSCTMTCTAMYAAFKSSSVLVYTIQLHLDGLKDAGTSLSSSVLIESLIRQRKAWWALEMKAPLTYQTQPVCNLEDLAGGAFAHMGGDHFEISWLPTTRNASGRILRTPSIGFTGILGPAFTMDPTQNLAVFLEKGWSRIHIRTISTNTVHPRALTNPLKVTYGPGGNQSIPIHYSSLQIARDVVAVYTRNVDGETRVLVWDWTTSDLILDIPTSFNPCLPSLWYSFVLLDSAFFFIVTEDTCGTIRLYKLVRFHAATQAVHLATLHLPPTSPGIAVNGIDCHTGPIEANPRAHTPFMQHDDDRLHMLSVQYKQETQHGWRFHDMDLFLHQRVLRKYACRACGAHAPLDIPWAEWGPPHTRVALSCERSYEGRRCVYDQRAILKQEESRRMVGSPHAVDVWDFSRAAVLSAQNILDAPATASAKGNPGRLLPSSMIRTTDAPLFLDDVETHLPCVLSTLHLTQSYSGYMIYADGVIGVNNTSHGGYVMDIYPI